MARLRELTRGGTTIVAGSLDPALSSRADVVLELSPNGRPAGSVPTTHPEADHALV
jgi:hypothetical protein